MDSSGTSILSSSQKEMIFENMSDGVMTVDSDGIITYFNSACANIFGITSPDDIIGMSFSSCFMANKKNRAFNMLFDGYINNNERPEKINVRYRSGDITKHLNIAISLIHC